jgi:dTDP-6-deoxy-L-talose 4-dehydrogenase (NAD+)
MRIFVTGATGFIGSAVVKLAISQGHEVAGLVRAEKAVPFRRLFGAWPIPGIISDLDWRAVEKFRPDACIHAAWIATPGTYLEAPENEQWLKWSEEFVSRFVNRGARPVVALGTCIEYEMTGKPLSEESAPLAPVSRYARCKDELRQRLEALAAAERFSFCWGRVFYPYGPGEHRDRLCSAAIRNLRAGQPFEVKNPRTIKDYIFIDDLAAALLFVVQSDISGAINLGTGTGVSVGEMARVIGELLHRPELIELPEEAATDPHAHVVADAGKLKSLGWLPQWSLRRGLQKLIETVEA